MIDKLTFKHDIEYWKDSSGHPNRSLATESAPLYTNL
jgi:hypothetical protein